MINWFVSLEVKGDLKGLKDDMTGMKDNVEGVKDELEGVKDDVTGIKDSIQNVVSGRCRHSAIFMLIFKSLFSRDSYWKFACFVIIPR